MGIGKNSSVDRKGKFPILRAVGRFFLILLAGIFAISPAQARGAADRGIALTFDDLPCLEGYAPLGEVRRINDLILAALRHHRAPATAFVNEHKIFWRGEGVERTKILEKWVAAGHELGNHTASHGKLSNVGPAAFQRDVIAGERTCNDLLRRTGKRMRFFRFPALDRGQGDVRRQVEQFLRGRGYTIAGITADSRDWEYNARHRQAMQRGDAAEGRAIRREFLNHLRALCLAQRARGGREILLLHACTLTAECGEEIMDIIQRLGFTVHPLEWALGTDVGQPNSVPTSSGSRGTSVGKRRTHALH
jgi:peptidoglycan/xylan/chitin deacetylase (PgdA/CDA1 family)